MADNNQRNPQQPSDSSENARLNSQEQRGNLTSGRKSNVSQDKGMPAQKQTGIDSPGESRGREEQPGGPREGRREQSSGDESIY